MKRVKALLLGSWLVSGILSAEESDFWHRDEANYSGPLKVQHLTPGHWSRGVDIVPTADDLQERRVQADVNLSWANLFMVDAASDSVIDTEWVEARLSIVAGITPQTVLGLNVPFHSRIEGFGDSIAEEAHDVFGNTDARSAAPRNTSRIFLDSSEGGIALTDGSGIGDVQLILSRMSDPGQVVPFTTTVHIGVTFPTGDETELFGSGETGVFGGLMHEHQLAKWFAYHIGGQFGWTNQEELNGVELEDTYYKGFFGIEFVGESTSFLIQSAYHSRWVADENLGVISEDPLFVTAGFRWGLIGGQLVELALSQNINAEDNRSETQGHFSMSQRF